MPPERLTEAEERALDDKALLEAVAMRRSAQRYYDAAESGQYLREFAESSLNDQRLGTLELEARLRGLTITA
jgi:hypothetical protein